MGNFPTSLQFLRQGQRFEAAIWGGAIWVIVMLLVWLPMTARAQDAVEKRALPALPMQSEQQVTGTATPETDAAQSNGSILDLSQPMPQKQTPESANPIDVSDAPKPLRIGMVAERGTTYLQGRIEPFRRYVQQSLNQPVEVIGFRAMQALIAAHTSGQIDYAIYPASTFAMAQASCGCLMPLVAPFSTNAPDGIYMLLVVRGESNIRNLADMTGRSIALSSKSAALPFYVALNELRLQGLNPDRDLSTLYRRDTPQEALEMLEKGEVDAALVWSTTHFNQSLFTSEGAVAAYQQAKQTKGNNQPAQPDFLSIWRSRAIPAGPHAVYNEMPKQQRAELIKALKRMKQDDPDAYDAVERYYDAGFQSVTLESYAPLIAVATAR